MNGHIFTGGGVELAPPGIFKLSAVYGRFLKPVNLDTNNINAIPSFRRLGGGLRIGIAKNKDYINLIVFKAKDDMNSIDFVANEFRVTPQENIVYAFNTAKVFAKRILFTGELAGSAITKDTRAETSNDKSIYSFMGLYTPRNSSSYYKAIKSALTYTANIFSLGLGYERIDPGYRTLGAYYFNNDLENYTVNGTTNLLGGKINLGANVGTQRNNLDNNNVSNMRRMVGISTLLMCLRKLST